MLPVDYCCCCGKPIPSGTLSCHVCKRKYNLADGHPVKQDCVNYNDNGYFCELTGAECIGSSCVSFKKEVE